MYTNTQMEKLWQRYQSEGVARNMSMQQFCSMNNVPYNSFEKYLKTRRNMSDVYPVSITDLPEDNEREDNDDTLVLSNEDDEQKPLRIYASFKISNGLHIAQGNLNYSGLRQLVDKLEVLC